MTRLMNFHTDRRKATLSLPVVSFSISRQEDHIRSEIKLPSQQIFVLIIQWLSIITQKVYLLSINYHLKSSTENCILVAELNADDLLGECLCTLIEKMVKPKDERMELTEVIKQLTSLLPAERKI